MAALDHDQLIAMLNRLKLTVIRDQLDALLDEATRSEMALREALGFLVSREIARGTGGASAWPAKSPSSRSCENSLGSTGPLSPRWISDRSESWPRVSGSRR